MISFKVEGMTCGGCARSVTNAIKRVDPAASLNIDVPWGKVEVSSSARVEQLKGAIEAAGYQVTLEPG